MNKTSIFSLERFERVFSQNSKPLRPQFPLKPECIGHDLIYVPIDDDFFECQARMEKIYGPMRSDLSDDEKAFITDIVGTMNLFDLERFLKTGCGVTNPSELSWEGIFARLRWFQSKQSEKPAKHEPAPIKERLTLEQKAIAVLYKNPCLSDKEIAEAIGCSRTTLYDFRGFKKARAALRAGKREICKGTKYNNRLESYED